MNYLEISGYQKSLNSGQIENYYGEPIPWYSYPAIEFVEDKIKNSYKIFEYGSGQSTLFYAQRSAFVISIEHDEDFFLQLKNKIIAKNIQNVTLTLQKDGYKYSRAILDYEDEFFDIVVIDGIERENCARQCINKLKKTGFIIFDNSDRTESNFAINFLLKNGFQKIDFYGILPSQIYKNCTSIFFLQTDFLGTALPSHKKSCLGLSLGQIENKLQMEKNIMAQKHIKNLCLFLTNYYPNFLSSIYRKKPEISFLNFKKQKDFLLSEFFGDADFYSEGLKKLDDWDADDIIMNCVPLQQAWAKENNFNNSDLMQILIEQIRRANPDVVYLHDMGVGTKEFIAIIRPYTRLIVGQIACPLFPQADYHGFDIIISSFPHYVERFRQQGITAYYQPLAFDSRVLEKIGKSERIYPVTFVGGISQAHQKGTEFLEELAHHVPIEFWGYGSEYLAEHTLIKQRHHGEVWGLDMFSILAQSKITINRHIDVAENYANNMRLFEATGCGALLITDYKDNLHELFEIGKEIIAYRSVEECVNLIKYYLEHPEEANAIAKAGQLRTLREHSYTNRMKQTALILEEHLHKKQNLSQADEQPMSNTPEHIIQQQALALCEQANIIMSEEDFEGALQLFDGAARIYNQIENLQYARAICLSQLGRFQEAKEALEAELQLNPHKPECQSLLHDLLIKLDESFPSEFLQLKPSTFMVETALGCDLKCPECAIGDDIITRKKGWLKFEKFKIIADKIRPFCKYLYLHIWGEPMLNKDIFKMIEYASSFTKINISTNGQILNENTSEMLIKSGVTDLIVSIDGVSQQIYEKYRVEGDVKKAFQSLEMLNSFNLKYGKKVNIMPQFIMFKHNQHEAKLFGEFCESIGLKALFKAPYIRSNSKYENSDIPEYTRSKYPDIASLRQAMKSCQDPKQVFTILLDGTCVMCCNDHNGVTNYGNIYTQEVMDVWNSPKYQKDRFDIIRGNAPQSCIDTCLTWTLEEKLARKIHNIKPLRKNQSGNSALSSSKIKANSTAPNLDWLHKALKQAGYDIDVSDASPLSTEERRRLPEFEYLPNGWNTQDKYIQGWNIQSIVQKSVETFPVLKTSLESANAFSEQPIDHNNKLAFAYVLSLAARNKDRVSILDWGGGIGQYYLLAKAILPKDVHIDYYCKDLPAFCHAGKQLLPDVSFYDNEEDCFQKNYDLVFASGAIQYSQNWQQLVQQLASITKEYLYITRTPMVQNVPSFVVVQRPYQYGYQTEYKGWFINRQEFLNCASKLPLSLVREFLVMEHCHPVNAPEPSVSRGFLFKKQGSN